MAAPYNPPVKGEDFVFRVALDDMAAVGRAKSNPTIAAGDFQVDKDGGGLANLSTLPTVDPSSTKLVKITLSATEMTADVVTIVCSDQTDPPEWADLIICIPTTT
jgi:hypothetical protein